jgi:hypothetical protein|mmetsp:Transcript_12539/g.22736  ORF Transcript_12539/g.22736 Transcript_12539/m.22736 type:complete len:84 (-) Transcript_12539:226-477(-)
MGERKILVMLYSTYYYYDTHSFMDSHPGFNKTEMTKKYEAIWEAEGAVDPSEGAKRVLFEVMKGSMDTTGQFINCEDGLQMPW